MGRSLVKVPSSPIAAAQGKQNTICQVFLCRKAAVKVMDVLFGPGTGNCVFASHCYVVKPISVRRKASVSKPLKVEASTPISMIVPTTIKDVEMASAVPAEVASSHKIFYKVT